MPPALLALRCLDLTSLKDDDTDASIEALVERADTPHGAPAALCVYPRFVATARRALEARRLDGVRVATVVNFPRGESSPDTVAAEIAGALDAGAHEIDAVFPWRTLRAGETAPGLALVKRCRRASKNAALKVILETGELDDPSLIRTASLIALDAGADFIKTSTGKVPVNATPAAASVMLAAIRDRGAQAGLKVAGGVATLADVNRYVALAAPVYGEQALSPRTLRFGASGLLPVLLAALDDGPSPGAASGH